MLARFERENTNNIEETPTKMKKLLLFMAIAAVGLGACDDRRPQPLTIDNALTADEIAAGRLTPEVMWKMSRAGSSSLSPDGKTLLYAQTDYNMAQNRGVTTIWVQDMASGAVTRLTDTGVEQRRSQVECRRAENLFPVGSQRLDAGVADERRWRRRDPGYGQRRGRGCPRRRRIRCQPR